MLVIRSHVNSWGNGVGVRIPKKFREMLNLIASSEVDLILKEEGIMIKPVKKAVNKISSLKNDGRLKERLKQITSETKPDFKEIEDFMNSKPVGKEVW